jgi:hypothetical protein
MSVALSRLYREVAAALEEVYATCDVFECGSWEPCPACASVWTLYEAALDWADYALNRGYLPWGA